MNSVSPSLPWLCKTLIISSLSFFCFPLFALSPPEKAQTGLFLENKGQVRDQYYMPRPDVFYYGEVDGLSYHLTTRGIHYQMVQYPAGFQQKELLSKATKSKHDLDIGSQSEPITIYRVDVNYQGANKRAEVVSSGGSSSVSHFYNVPYGAEPALNVRSWQFVTMKEIYTGIDLRYYQGKHGGLESDFVVQPGADFNQIALAISGAELSINTRGELVMHTPFGDILEGPVFAHQNGKEVTSQWVVDGDVVRFELVGQVNPALPLIIDPPVRLYGTYFGGSKDDEFNDVSSGQDGSFTLVGSTVSTSMIATTGAHQVSFGGGSKDGVVTKFSSDGDLLWSTYLGGNEEDIIFGCSVDLASNILVAGPTGSLSGISTPDAHQPNYAGGYRDGFIVKFDPNGTRLWGTYFGGNDWDEIHDCKTDLSNRVVIVGLTKSVSGISTSGSFQPNFSGDDDFTDAFVAVLSGNNEIDWGTYIGTKSGNDRGSSCAIDDDNNIIFAGAAWKSNTLASPGAYQTEVNGQRNALVFKFSESGERIWSTYFGGNNTSAYDVVVDSEGNVILCGETDFDQFIVSPNAHQEQYGGDLNDAFLAQFDKNGSFNWGTCYGGEKEEIGNALAIGLNDDIYFAGFTTSFTNIASVDGYDNAKDAFIDGFIAKFSKSGARYWGTYYGGEDWDGIYSCALSDNNRIVFAGYTYSSEAISTMDGYKPIYSGGGVESDAFFAIFQDETSGLIPVVQTEPLAVLPNPTSGMVYITDLPESSRLTVRDVQGMVVLERSVTTNAFDLDLGHLPSGMYILRVDAHDTPAIKVARVVVE